MARISVTSFGAAYSAPNLTSFKTDNGEDAIKMSKNNGYGYFREMVKDEGNLHEILTKS